MQLKQVIPPEVLQPQDNVSETEKTLVITALSKRKELLASNNTTAIRNYFLKVMPADTGIINFTDTQIMNIANLELQKLLIPSSVIEDSTTKWARVGDSIQLLVKYNGKSQVLSAQKINGTWY